MFVDGTTTQINSTTLEIADFIVGIASTATTDLLADGAIGIQIGPDNTLLYEHNGGTNPSLKSSENLNVASGKGYQINQTEVLNATTLGSGVTNSSLTSVGTLSSLNVSGVSTFQSHVHLGDNDELRFGAGDDFKIYHDPDDARLENSNGDVKFKNTGSYYFFDEDGGETLASFINDGAVNLYHDGNKKFETTGYGVTVFGTTESQQLSVSGVSTFSDDVDLVGNPTGIAQTSIQFHKGDGTSSDLDALNFYDRAVINLGVGHTGNLSIGGHYVGGSFLLGFGSQLVIDGSSLNSTKVKLRTNDVRDGIIVNPGGGSNSAQ